MTIFPLRFPVLAAILLFFSSAQAQSNLGKIAGDNGRLLVSGQIKDGNGTPFNDTSLKPRIVTETDSDRAIALDAVTLVAGPFSVTTENNLSPDTTTRIALFVEDLQFIPGSTLVVSGVDAQLRQFQLPVEALAAFSNFPFEQLIVRLPGNVAVGDLMITVVVNGQLSNTARISIKP